MTGRKIMATVLALGVAGCSGIEKPYRHDPRQVSPLVTHALDDAAGVGVARPRDLPPEMATAVAEAMAEALQALDLPASVGRGNALAYRLVGTPADTGTRVVWTLKNARGQELTTVTTDLPITADGPVPTPALAALTVAETLARAITPEQAEAALWARVTAEDSGAPAATPPPDPSPLPPDVVRAARALEAARTRPRTFAPPPRQPAPPPQPQVALRLPNTPLTGRVGEFLPVAVPVDPVEIAPGEKPPVRPAPSSPTPGRDQGADSPALNTDAVAVVSVTGAPGNGNPVLGEAMGAGLERMGFTVAPPYQAAWQVKGAVRTVRLDEDRTRLFLTWTVLDNVGQEVGKAEQDNVVPTALVQGQWGKLAYDVGLGAAYGVEAVIRHRAD